MVMAARKRVRPSMPECTPFDPEPGERRDVRLGEHWLVVTYLRQGAKGWRYYVDSKGYNTAEVTRSASGNYGCLSCKLATCIHTAAVRRVHQQLWGKND